MVNLGALNCIMNDTPGSIEAKATSMGLDPAIAQGVAVLLIANDGNLASLSKQQREHYDQVIVPLLENV